MTILEHMAVLVRLIWISEGTIAEMKSADQSDDGNAFEGEAPKARAAREIQEEKYCKDMTQAYESYLNAPKL